MLRSICTRSSIPCIGPLPADCSGACRDLQLTNLWRGIVAAEAAGPLSKSGKKRSRRAHVAAINPELRVPNLMRHVVAARAMRDSQPAPGERVSIQWPRG
ncbi:hypothetical protein BRAS3843_40001 [Bradyrhizobium sp. STM 3843]|nr:hypothetical protein BRAS3843_40001 [Bradyrhizobium sp. STM 3843]